VAAWPKAKIKFVPTAGLLKCLQGTESRAGPARGTLGTPFGKDSLPDGAPRESPGTLEGGGASLEDCPEKSLSRKKEKEKTLAP
jgi:hypothetical protein